MKEASRSKGHRARASGGPGAVLVLSFAFLALPVLLLAAQDSLSVASGELKSASGGNLVFVNYEGPQSRIESAAEIVAIGSGLGQALPRITADRPVTKPTLLRSGDPARYAVIRAVDPTVKTGLDADIIVIGPDAQVDHVKNLRRIISGYLQAAWGYSAADAGTLAVYVTVYNAVHRGDLAYIKGKYKPAVQAELSAENAGLSLRYDEWPGKSRILIPLGRGAVAGAIGAVDTGAVSDKATVQSLKAQPDQGLGDRQAMTELKDRETDQRAADLAKQQADTAKAQAELDAKNQAIAAEKAKLEADKAAAATAPAGAAADKAAPEPGAVPPAGDAGAAQAATIADREAALKAKEAEAAAQQTALDQKKEEAAQASADLAAKKEEVAADRAGIAADQKEGIAADVAAKAAAAAPGLYLYQLIDTANPFARLVYVDASTGKLIRASTLNSIRPQAVVDAGDTFVAVAGREGGNATVRLVRLAKADLVQQAQGSVDLFPNTGLWMQGDSFYAVAKDGAGYRLVRFDQKLAPAALSPGQVNPWTALVAVKDGLVVQGSGGSFQVLAPDTLKLVREFKP